VAPQDHWIENEVIPKKVPPRKKKGKWKAPQERVETLVSPVKPNPRTFLQHISNTASGYEASYTTTSTTSISFPETEEQFFSTYIKLRTYFNQALTPAEIQSHSLKVLVSCQRVLGPRYMADIKSSQAYGNGTERVGVFYPLFNACQS